MFYMGIYAQIYVILFFIYIYERRGASLVAQLVKNLLAVQETWVWSLGWEDPLKKQMAIHSSILAWKISWAEEPGGLQSIELQGVSMTEQLTLNYLLMKGGRNTVIYSSLILRSSIF